MNDSGCEDTVPSMVHSCKLPDESDASMRARLFTSLSQSFPHSQLYKALHGIGDINLNGGDNSEDDDDSLYGDHLSNSCFASLRMDRRDSDDLDDDLQSLEWLQNEDLLKNIGGEKLDKDDDDNEEQKENEDIKPNLNMLPDIAPRQTPIISPYLPQKHVNSKPPYSFSCLIFMAVEDSLQKKLPVKDIYNWILTKFPYFQNAPTGWKNSVRHNLSLNKCFKKVEKDKGQSIGKGSLWCIDPAYRPNLLQALRKTPYHPYHQLQMTSSLPQNNQQYQSFPGLGRTVLPLTQRPVPNTVSPHLFPFLSKRLAQTSRDVDNDTKDVANTLLSMNAHKIGNDHSQIEDTGPTWKHHKRSTKRSSSPVTITDHPHSDHAYSSTKILDDDFQSASSPSSIDEEYDFGDAVLSFLLRHTGDPADDLFKQLECPELSCSISDHFLCPHNEECDESDYQSSMEWDSDEKDEVDGDVLPHKKLKIDLNEDSDNVHGSDEQKEIVDGASVLMEIAIKCRNISSTSNSPEFGRETKKRERLAGKKNASAKKGKPVKKKENKKQAAAPEVGEPSDHPSKRGVSRRKNAGNNGKYDSEEYAFVKTSRSPSKSRPEKASKSKPAKSSTASKEAKSKSLKKTAKTAKKAAEKNKLKLSKSFGAPKKIVLELETEKGADSDGKTQKSAKRRRKANPATKISSVDNKSTLDNFSDKTVAQIKTEDMDTIPGLNNNDVKFGRTASDCKEPLHVVTESREAIDPLATKVKQELLSPAGDAPAQQQAKISESKLPSQKFKTGAGGAKVSNDCRSDGNKNGPSHKSPHFTRFSKKKAALS